MQVRRSIVLDAPREEVWRALTEAEQLAQWFANEVELDTRRGGTGVFRWDDGSARRATVERVEEERVFAFRWSEEGDESAASAVSITLDEVAGGTRVTVVESAPPSAGARAEAAFAGEWSWGLELLASLPRLRRLAHV